MTAAGKVPPAKVLVVGAGVAGLAANRRRGQPRCHRARHRPRPEVADQVKSLVVSIFRSNHRRTEVSATGYAKEMGDDYKAREAQLYADQSEDVDIIVTTALIPGRPRRASSPPRWWPP